VAERGRGPGKAAVKREGQNGLGLCKKYAQPRSATCQRGGGGPARLL